MRGLLSLLDRVNLRHLPHQLNILLLLEAVPEEKTEATVLNRAAEALVGIDQAL